MSMSALLRAVRDEIRTNAAYSPIPRQVQVENTIDEAPSNTGDLYVIVAPGGTSPGPAQNTMGGAIDKLYGVDVSIAMKSPVKPRDRRREMNISITGSLEVHKAAINTQVDWQYDVLLAANAFILAEDGGLNFIEPLRFSGQSPISESPAALFRGLGREGVALVQTIQYRLARRITRTP